jgi:POT family proton-dependent oligopeptide transporter
VPGDDRGFFGQPRGLATLFFTEMWERFSFYGLRPLLVLFMAAALSEGGFGFDRTQASSIVGIYAASVYLASLPGGWVADRLLGLRRAITRARCSSPPGTSRSASRGSRRARCRSSSGLILIVLGTGLLKPNISAIVGDLYPEGGARRDAGFSIFYMGINVGAFFGQLVTGILGESVGWHWGFGAAGVGMAIGLVTFLARQRATLGTLGTAPTRHPDAAVQARRSARLDGAVDRARRARRRGAARRPRRAHPRRAGDREEHDVRARRHRRRVLRLPLRRRAACRATSASASR